MYKALGLNREIPPGAAPYHQKYELIYFFYFKPLVNYRKKFTYIHVRKQLKNLNLSNNACHILDQMTSVAKGLIGRGENYCLSKR